MTEHNLFQEVEEDLERQKLAALWKKYGFWIILTAVGMVVSTASSTAYRSWKADREQQVTAEFLAASQTQADAPKTIDALQKFAEANSKDDKAALALLHAGATALERDDKTKAIQLFDEVSANTKIDAAFRQLGDLLSVQAQLDTGDAAKLTARLQPLSADGAPWRFSAKEALAQVALRSGDTAKAKQALSELSNDKQAPQSIAARASEILRAME